MSARGRGALLLLSVATACATLAAPSAPLPIAPPANPQPAPPDRTGETLELSTRLRVRVRSGRTLELEVQPVGNEGVGALAERISGSADFSRAIQDRNRQASPDGFVRVPFALLSDEYRALVLLNLFPTDRADGDDWIHVAKSGAVPTYDEGLWQIAEWFTGSGSRFEELRRANGLTSPEAASGREIRIPGALLHRARAPGAPLGRRSAGVRRGCTGRIRRLSPQAGRGAVELGRAALHRTHEPRRRHGGRRSARAP